MLEENIKVVRRAYASASDHHDLDRELYHPEFEFDATEVAPDTGGPMDFKATLEFLRSYWATFDEFRSEVEAVIYADETRVVVHARDHGRIRGTDSEMQTYRFQTFTLREDRIVRMSVHADRARALEAVGLLE